MDKHLKLGYTNLWFEFGLLTEQELVEQVAIFEKSDDKNVEHYRYRTFKRYLTTRNILTDKELDNYLKVVSSEKDEPMASSAIVDILREIELTDLQFDKVCLEITELGLGTSTKKIITRQVLLRKLKTKKLTDELFTESLTNGDSVVHEYLLNLSNPKQLKQIAEYGATKAIKNIATEKINRIER